MARINKCYLPLIITLLTICLAVGIVMYKKPIESVTYSELVSINGIGDYKANVILDYVKCNDDVKVGELLYLDGIGVVLVDKLRKIYR